MSESFDDEHLAQLIGLLETALWDSDNEGGKLKPPPEIRTFEQKIVTRDGAYRKLSAIIPGGCLRATPSAQASYLTYKSILAF